MKLTRNILRYILCGALLFGAATYCAGDAYARKSKASTAQSDKKSKKSSTSSLKKSNKSDKSDKSSKSNKSNSKSNSKSAKSSSTKTYHKNYSTSAKSSSSSRTSTVAKVADTARTDSLTLAVNRSVLAQLPADVSGAGLRVNSVVRDDRAQKVDVGLNENFTYLPVNQKFIDNIRKGVSASLPDSISQYRINLNVGDRPLSYYINKIDRANPAGHNDPFVRPANPVWHATKGLENDIIALWHSHGRYFAGGGWTWQRPFLFETAEDVYTMGYILPFIVPMLENAGAYVMLPRERDTSKHEVIVDNDTNDGGFLGSQPTYKEANGSQRWEEGKGDGFIYDLPDFRDTENPFKGGTYRQVKTVKSGKESKAGWYANIPEDGEYAIYVSYKTLPNSAKDAKYTVKYSGGSKDFYVNQTMGGGTWIYLGTFPLEAGYSDTEPVVVLTNLSKDGGDTVVTADAVKIGGGMGNIARSTSRQDVYTYGSKSVEVIDSEGDEEDIDSGQVVAETTPPANSGYSNKFSTSGMPRFVEGARYWLHWAGFPDSVYSPHHGRDDYKDDYTSRGLWVNYLAGGSSVLPNREGLNIPVDMSFALHTDAGKRTDDSTVGTLGIYYTNGGGKYADGTPRMNSRILTDLIMRQIVGDIRATFEPNWTRRSMWDKSYLEAKTPEVPATLIELLSHQNFGDMKYGLDPNFRFTVGRAIYKGIGRFLAERKGRQFVAQPLPVNSFMISRVGKFKYKLSWQPTPDPLESTAMPTKYIIEQRTGDNMGFSVVDVVSKPEYDLVIPEGKDYTYLVHSFRIIAVNDGGQSFPSEVLALRESPTGKAPMLVINGFTRVSGPASFSEGGSAGFDSRDDFGVPYIRDISFTGHQTEFRRGSGNAFGNSGKDYVTEVVAGNTFDFVAEHGTSLAEAGNGFVSASLKAVEEGKVDLEKFKFIDLILGKQKATVVGGGKSGINYRTFPKALQARLRKYLEHGGHLFISGAYVASDLYGPYADDQDRLFAQEVLGIEPNDVQKERAGKLTVRSNSSLKNVYNYSNTLNEDIYIVENPDILLPVKQSNIILDYTDSGLPAAIGGRREKGKVFIMSVPFETIEGEEQRDTLMKDILRWFEN